jgi:hypothetical protein
MNIETTGNWRRQGGVGIPPGSRPRAVVSLPSLLLDLDNKHACNSESAIPCVAETKFRLSNYFSRLGTWSQALGYSTAYVMQVHSAMSTTINVSSAQGKRGRHSRMDKNRHTENEGSTKEHHSYVQAVMAELNPSTARY